jgi:hypothetical protein
MGVDGVYSAAAQQPHQMQCRATLADSPDEVDQSAILEELP